MNKILAICFLAGLTILFIGFFSLCYNIGMGGTRKSISFRKPDEKLIVGLFLALSLLLAVYMLGQNRFVYYWDYGFYWSQSYTWMLGFSAYPVEQMKSLYASICYDDYNLLLPTLIALPLRVFGYSFTRYVLVNFVMFYIPAFCIMYATFRKLQIRMSMEENRRQRLTRCIEIVVLLVCFNTFYLAMFQGYIDIAALTPVSLSFLLLIDYNPFTMERKQVLRDFCIAGCLVSAFLFRRYFAYYVVGYGFALSMYTLYSLLCIYRQEGKVEKSTLVKALGNLVLVGGALSPS